MESIQSKENEKNEILNNNEDEDFQKKTECNL